MAQAFYTMQFTASHMREPKGRGSWMFAQVDDATGQVDENFDNMLTSPSMTYTEAKRWAKAQRPMWDGFEVMP